ncbi:MAG: hypothetical protein KDE45_24275, partial [Caldilineaceae bacterium]|nr:hypothetical protein [Caldilineaceae bacterium]
DPDWLGRKLDRKMNKNTQAQSRAGCSATTYWRFDSWRLDRHRSVPSLTEIACELWLGELRSIVSNLYVFALPMVPDGVLVGY